MLGHRDLPDFVGDIDSRDRLTYIDETEPRR
jgi:hypothetical protein